MSSFLKLPHRYAAVQSFRDEEEFWEHLLLSIEQNNVLPIVGQGVTTYGEDNHLLAPWLAERLADALHICPEDLPTGYTLNDVACRYLMNQQPSEFLYTRLFQILRNERPSPGASLKQLASIEPFRFFLSTTVDSLLTDALDEVRYGDGGKTEVCEFQGNEDCDLPRPRRQITGSLVYHILGRASNREGYVVWENDLLEYVLSLNKHVPQLPNLSRELRDPNLRFLVLGLNFSDWLLRFFLRTIRQNQLSKNNLTKIEYLAEESSNMMSDGLVMFFGSVTNLQFLQCDPRNFVAELSQRWHERQGTSPGSASQPKSSSQLTSPETQGLEGQSVFISYSRKDIEAAKRLSKSLKALGIPVWIDLEELSNGMDYNYELADQVRTCSLFISLVSKTTESLGEAYFHMERNWAARRAERLSDFDRGEFYHPVIIDDLKPDQVKREPRMFQSSHMVSLRNGEITQDFADRILEILAALRNKR